MSKESRMGSGLNEVTYSKVYTHTEGEGARMEFPVIRDTNRNSKVNALEQQTLNSFPRRRSRPIRSPVSLIHLVVFRFRAATHGGRDNEGK